jgi:hypothetical protein
VPEIPDSVGLPIAFALGAFLILWYFVGNELMRRRAHRLALWSKRVVDPLGGRQSISWLSGQAFRLDVDEPSRPFHSASITGLVESWDVPVVWAWNRIHGRRDLVLLRLDLVNQPLWGLEVYRPGSILAGDARHFARQEGWQDVQRADLRIAGAGETPLELAEQLVRTLDAERDRLIRLAVRRQDTHLLLAVTVPDLASLDPVRITRLVERLAARLQRDASASGED